MMKQWGLNHIVFGSDYHYQSPKEYLGYLRNYLPLTNREIRNILNNDLSKKIFLMHNNNQA